MLRLVLTVVVVNEDVQVMLKNLVVDDHGGVVVGVLPDDGLGVEVGVLPDDGLGVKVTGYCLMMVWV